MLIRRSGWLVVGLVLPTLIGCQREPAISLVPVTGRVVYRGQGVKRATVQLIPDAAGGTHAPSATGQTDESGSFTLQTPPFGPGVAPGRYKVTVQQYGPPGLPPKYGNPAETPLRAQVPEGGLAQWDVKLD